MTLGPRRCDHDKRKPRLTPAAAIRSTHHLIEVARERAQALYDRRFDPEVSEPFRRRQKGRRGGFGRLVVNVGHLKSQRAEVDVAVLVRFFDGCNVRTGEVGRWNKDTQRMERWSVEDIVKDTGFTPDRIERALSDLCAGEGRLLFRRQPKVEKRDPKTGRRKYEGLVAETKLTAAAWKVVGLDGRRQVLLAKEDEEAAKAERKAEIKAERAAEPPPPPEFKPPTGYYSLRWRLEAEGMTEAEAHVEALDRLARPPPPPAAE